MKIIKNRFLFVMACVLLTVLLTPRVLWAFDAPVGMAARVTGSVTVVQGGKKQPLRLLGRLQNGAQLVAARGAGAVVVLFGAGQRFQIGSNQKAVVGATRVAGAQVLPALSGPSQDVVKMLGTARVGAALARTAPSFQRLLPASPGYLTEVPSRFEWQPILGAATQNFTLFDGADNVFWSISASQNRADYPATAPQLVERRPYLWKSSGFGATGKPMVESRWGIVTLLSAADAREMEAAVTASAPSPGAAQDAVVESLLMQIEIYRSFGALNRALEILDDERLREVPDIAGARLEIVESLSPFARILAGAPMPATP